MNDDGYIKQILDSKYLITTKVIKFYHDIPCSMAEPPLHFTIVRLSALKKKKKIHTN